MPEKQLLRPMKRLLFVTESDMEKISAIEHIELATLVGVLEPEGTIRIVKNRFGKDRVSVSPSQFAEMQV